MNRNLASALVMAATAAAAVTLAAVAANTAYADDITIDKTPLVSTRTRAEVQAELANQVEPARIRNDEWTLQSNHVPQLKSTYTAEQARSSYKSSRDEVNALNAEDSGSSYLKMSPRRANSAAAMGAPAQ